MSAFVSILMLGSSVMLVYHYLERATGGHDARSRRWFSWWLFKGVGVPLLVWLAINCGLVPGLPPFLPEALLAKSAGERWLRVADSWGPAGALIASYWAAVTFAWLTWVVARQLREEARRVFLGSALAWSLVTVPFSALLLREDGWIMGGAAGVLCLLPLTHAAIPLLRPEKRALSLSRAIGMMKTGKADGAEWEIIRQLEQADDDYEGWMLLAELYATQFHDLAAADRTVRSVCDQPNVNASQVNAAFLRLAGWHVALGKDPDAARRALAEICRRYPGTPLARMAQHRIRQLPVSREELEARRRPLVVPLPQTEPAFSSAPVAGSGAAPKPVDRAAAQREADACVERLTRDPNDVNTRERLARAFAGLGRPDLAIEQLELLVGMPGQPEANVTGWMALLAEWHLHLRQDPETARGWWRKLVEDHPRSPQAFEAQRRLAVMAVEEKFRRACRARVAS